MNFQLKVERFDQSCRFELSWGTGQQLYARLHYPESITALYLEWQRIYMSCYLSALRARVEKSGSIDPPPIDWPSRLVQAEVKFLSEFHHWLRSAELFEIRAVIAKCQGSPSHSSGLQTVNLFITCYPMELERLPWEAWEIDAEFKTSGTIRIIRTPANIPEKNSLKQHITRRKKTRILAILGDETGLNFKEEYQVLQSLAKLAEITLVGWQPGQNIAELKAKIREAIADERGWDLLFFAGHSNETTLTGGELGIAPNVSISICEISPQLLQAKERGLQFALFNSCRGLSLASSLIGLGLSQVAVMREPIRNDVAQVFMVQFFQKIAEYKDVQEALTAACQYLKVEKNLTYPSAYLIPSLFCYPNAELFRIPPPRRIPHWVEQFKPSLPEGILLSALTFLSLSLPLQDWLLEKRVFTQAVYRQFTAQIDTASPPVLLVAIDEQSLRQAKIIRPNPMNRRYLAQLVDKLVAMKIKVIGIDYLLDRPHKESDGILAQSLQAAIQQTPSPLFVFAAVRDDYEGWLNVLPELASPNWSFQGDIDLLEGYMRVLPRQESQSQKLPFAYLVAFAYQLTVGLPEISNQLAKPHLENKTDFFTEINADLKELKRINYKALFAATAQRHSITIFSYYLGQMWLQPIIDYSIPPEQVYERVPAWKLLNFNANFQERSWQQQIAIIAPGGYGEAGVDRYGQDNLSLPDAVDYWFNQQNPEHPRLKFTGGEIHAYMVQHLLNRRLVIPIPNLWLVALVALLGKGLSILGKNYSLQFKKQTLAVLVGSIIVYGVFSLQLYISGMILLPFLLPSLTLAIYGYSLVRGD